jgi:hypothetical protein
MTSASRHRISGQRVVKNDWSSSISAGRISRRDVLHGSVTGTGRAEGEFRSAQTVSRHAVWLYFRFSLSLRDVEELLAERGVTVSYETIREWCALASALKSQAKPTIEADKVTSQPWAQTLYWSCESHRTSHVDGAYNRFGKRANKDFPRTKTRADVLKCLDIE